MPVPFTVLVMPIFNCPGRLIKYTHPSSLRLKDPLVQFGQPVRHLDLFLTDDQYKVKQSGHSHKTCVGHSLLIVDGSGKPNTASVANSGQT